MPILITGGLSDISNFLASRFSEDDQVLVLNNYSNGYNKILASQKFQTLNVDNRNEEAIRNILEKYNISKVIDVSLYSNLVNLNPLNSASELLLGITSVLDAIRKTEKLPTFVLVSGEDVYGNLATNRDENQPLEPVTFKGSGQMSLEALVHSYAVSYRIPTVIGRLSRFILTNSSDLIAHLKTLQNEEFVNILDINDAADGVVRISNTTDFSEPAQVFNISNIVELNVGQILQNASNVESRRAILDSTKIQQKFGWAQKIDVRQALSSGNVDHKYQSISPSFLVYGTGSQVENFTKAAKSRNISVKNSHINLESTSDKDVHNEIQDFLPSHLIYFSSNADNFDGDCFILRKNMSVNLYLPWLLASQAEKLNIHFTIIGNKTVFVGNNPENSSDAVKEHTEKMLRYFERTLQIPEAENAAQIVDDILNKSNH